MISHVYCFKRKSAGFAFNPVYSILDKKQYLDSLNQSLYDLSFDELEKYKDLELYYLGTFENVSLKLEVANEFVQDMASLASAAQAFKKKGDENGKKESN